MAWPTIFKLLGFGALLGADALKTESAKYKAQSVQTRPELEQTKFGWPEYMRPRDRHGNKLTDKQIIENGRTVYQEMMDKSNAKIAEGWKQYRAHIASGNKEAAAQAMAMIKHEESVKRGYAMQVCRYDQLDTSSD